MGQANWFFLVASLAQAVFHISRNAWQDLIFWGMLVTAAWAVSALIEIVYARRNTGEEASENIG